MCEMEITKKNMCVGCGRCAVECPQKAIQIKSNIEGFWEPVINYKKCIKCKKCRAVCVVNCNMNKGKSNTNYLKYPVYAAHYKESAKRKRSTSGGVCNALAEYVIKGGGIVYGVSYDDKYEYACYKRVTNIEDLEKIRGVKYIQSFPINYRQLKKDVESGKMVLMIGLPCAIVAAIEYVGRQYSNFFTVALICHGPTSNLVHQKYIAPYKNIAGFSLRKKGLCGINYVCVKKHNGKQFKELWAMSPYNIAFSNISRPSCYKCRYKLSAASWDVMVGDFWGLETDEFYKKDGNSVIVICSQKWGEEELLKKIGISYKKSDLKLVLENNPAIVTSTKKTSVSDELFNEIKLNGLSDIKRRYLSPKDRIVCYLKQITAFFPYWIIHFIYREYRKKY